MMLRTGRAYNLTQSFILPERGDLHTPGSGMFMRLRTCDAMDCTGIIRVIYTLLS